MTMTSVSMTNPRAPEATEVAAASLSRRLLVIAIALATAGMLLLWLYLQRYEAETSGGERVRLLTLLRAVPRGTVLTEQMLGVREVPISYVEARAVKAAELNKVRGIRTAMDLDPQDTLQWSDLAVAVEERDLSTLVQAGNRAVTIDARQNSLIRPGDYVDVLATFTSRTGADYAAATVVLLQRVLVLAVGNETQRQVFQGLGDNGRNGSGGGHNLTLSVELDEAQMVALADQNGDLSVILRSGSDPGVVDGLPDLTTNNLLDQAARANTRRASRTSGDAMPQRIHGTGKR
ncbi:MAG TPA: Flp pilus assembly protein CpaB [Polyangiales bacterium]|nr:Flp pilus assembly protein CpaB [Polyangiales bacterium]